MKFNSLTSTKSPSRCCTSVQIVIFLVIPTLVLSSVVRDTVFDVNNQISDDKENVPDASVSEVTAPANSLFENYRTIISDIIGFSALKFMLIMTVPFVFAIFLGAMMVLLFPFPLVTSTSGLAGAAAIGRRSGASVSSKDFPTVSLIEIIEDQLVSYLLGRNENDKVFEPVPMARSRSTMAYVPIIDTTPKPNKRQQMKIHVRRKFRKPRVHMDPEDNNSLTSNPDERCAERLVCEVGRIANPQFRGFINQILQDIPKKSRFKFSKIIKAYQEGLDSVMMKRSISQNGVLGPVYLHNICPKYTCDM